MSIHQIFLEINRQLTGLYPETEIESFSRILFRHYLGLTPAQVHLSYDRELPDAIEKQIQKAVDELRKYRPVQYIIGETEFYGLKFELTPDVLIPRPETEELVDWIIHEYHRDATLSMMDIGTGSGCIAVALSAHFPDANVWAVDISEAALTVAQRNARKNKLSVNFLLKDILNDDMADFDDVFFDVIVSNPPYVTPAEQQFLQPCVLEYEPHCALFTPENDPMIFYKRIAEFGLECLKDNGKIFFEMNEAFSVETAKILEQYGYTDIIPRKDINGKWRMVSATSQYNKSTQ